MNNGTKSIPSPDVNPFVGKLLHVQHTAASGTDGGAATSGSWETRPLTTVLTNEIGASLSSNVLKLPAGVYFASATAVFFEVDTHQLRLRNTTLSATILKGLVNSNNAGASDSGTITSCQGRFTLHEAANVELQSQVQTTQAADGFGQAGSFGDGEVYADLLIWKLS